jgi:tRNA uridine 5-carboxymethylaminomethyl modification enzyme
MRLTEVGRKLGLIDEARWEAFSRKRDAIGRELERLRSVWVNPRVVERADAERVLGKQMEHEHSLADLLRRPSVGYETLMGLQGGMHANAEVSRETLGELYGPVVEQIEIASKYAGYIERQRGEVERAAQYEHLTLPAELDYMLVSALSIEARQKLNKHRPETLGQASRISGITPAAISLLLVHLKRSKFKGFVEPEARANRAPA